MLTLQEVGPDVVLTASGSIDDFTGLTAQVDTVAVGTVNSFLGIAINGSGGNADTYLGIAGPTGFGTLNSNLTADTNVGDAVGISGTANLLFVPDGYIATTPISATSTFLGTNLAAMQVTPGVYTWTWIGDSAQLNAIAAIPEPSTYLAAIGALGLGGFVWVRRKRGNAACAVVTV